jgi:hypothetical protein
VALIFIIGKSEGWDKWKLNSLEFVLKFTPFSAPSFTNARCFDNKWRYNFRSVILTQRTQEFEAERTNFNTPTKKRSLESEIDLVSSFLDNLLNVHVKVVFNNFSKVRFCLFESLLAVSVSEFFRVAGNDFTEVQLLEVSCRKFQLEIGLLKISYGKFQPEAGP